MNPIGVVAAISAFLSIWFGHVAVRRLEFAVRRLWLCAAGFLIMGLLLEGLALVTAGAIASTAFGIVGITFLWDALELWRQERRVRKGHAPANQQNPRHAAILNEPGSRATTIDVVKSRERMQRQAEASGTNS